MKTKATLRIAKISRTNGNVSKREERRALEAAQRENVTGFDYLRATAMLRAVNGKSEIVSHWLSEMELGSLADNLDRTTVSLHIESNAAANDVRRAIDLIRSHVIKGAQVKSATVLLPAVDAALAGLR